MGARAEFDTIQASISGFFQGEAKKFQDQYTKIKTEVGKMIVGQDHVVDATLTALIAGGNILLEGVPGLGKTQLVKTLAQVLDLEFNRIQFTPDLMPADILGTNIMTTTETGGYELEFREGPAFTQLLLADEINRATPKTQSALLETMQEASITVGGDTYHLEPPFFVMATQNPLEQEGTYPLPEAQLDRFMFKVTVPFLSREELNEVINRTTLKQNIAIKKVIDGKRIMQLRNVLNQVVVAPPIQDYAVRLVLSTHPNSEFSPDVVKKFVKWGASPRAAQALILGSKVRALAEGRAHIACNDIQHFANDVLQHRILLNYDGQAENINLGDIIQ
ncbi:MAG: MoxR family ATPase, partial [Verrucomicrobiota bacterium]